MRKTNTNKWVVDTYGHKMGFQEVIHTKIAMF